MFNPEKHHRHSIRLKDYDYSQAGAYFVTICAWNRECAFGEIIDGEMQLNEWGEVVALCWDEIPIHFPNVELDAFVIMPNHVHGIIIIPDSVEARHASPLQQKTEIPRGIKRKSLGAIVGSFKSATTKRINQIRSNPGAPVWQRNYYEHIIRDEEDLHDILEYIAGNPVKWGEDEENPDKIVRA